MLEKLYSHSNEMTELALEEKPIPADLVRKVLREACLAHHIQPVVCGSALHGMGVQPLLNAVNTFLPSPIDRPPVEGIDPKKPDKTLVRRPSPEDPFCALVFKILPAKTATCIGFAFTLDARCQLASLRPQSR